jgi:hypothetical protein
MTKSYSEKHSKNVAHFLCFWRKKWGLLYKKNDTKERFFKNINQSCSPIYAKKVEESFELVLAVEKLGLSPRERGKVHKVICLQLIGTLYGANN